MTSVIVVRTVRCSGVSPNSPAGTCTIKLAGERTCLAMPTASLATKEVDLEIAIRRTRSGAIPAVTLTAGRAAAAPTVVAATIDGVSKLNGHAGWPTAIAGSGLLRL